MGLPNGLHVKNLYFPVFAAILAAIRRLVRLATPCCTAKSDSQLVASLLGLLRRFTSVTPVLYLSYDLQLITCFKFF
jgi:hypothetical protein